MFVGEIPCPNPAFHFRMYYNSNACKESMVLRAATANDQNSIMPGMIGKLIFLNRDAVRPGVVGREVIKMIEIYAELFGMPKIIEDKTNYNYLLKWFEDAIWVLHNASAQTTH